MKPQHTINIHQHSSRIMASLIEETKMAEEEVQDIGPTKHHLRRKQRSQPRQHLRQLLHPHQQHPHLRHILCPKHIHQLVLQHSHTAPGHNNSLHTTTKADNQVTMIPRFKIMIIEVVTKAIEVEGVEVVTVVVGVDMEVAPGKEHAISAQTTQCLITTQLIAQPTLLQQLDEID